MVAAMTDLESLVAEMAAGLKLVTGMLGLTVALLPAADRALVLDALAALEAENAPKDEAEQSQVATKSSAAGARTLTLLVEKFAAEIAASRDGPAPSSPGG